MVRRVHGEGALILGGGRALLMQLAHPAVARGVVEHSNFEADPVGRLLRTLRPVYAISFGTPQQARVAAARVGHRHAAVVGSGYRASDPALLLWVHATLIDSALLAYRRFVGPLEPADANRYYEETATIAELFGVPVSSLPVDLASFNRYVAECVANPRGLRDGAPHRPDDLRTVSAVARSGAVAGAGADGWAAAGAVLRGVRPRVGAAAGGGAGDARWRGSRHAPAAASELASTATVVSPAGCLGGVASTSPGRCAPPRRPRGSPRAAQDGGPP